MTFNLVHNLSRLNRPWFWRSAKTLIIGLVVYLLYVQVFVHSGSSDILPILKQSVSGRQLPYWLCALALVPINYLIESHKWWKLLASPGLSWSDSIRSILLGHTLGIVTPANVGEYGGRLLLLPRSQVVNGLSATLLSSIAQNIANIAFGFVGLIYFMPFIIDVDRWILMSTSFIGLVVLSVLLIGYKNIPSIAVYIKGKQWKWFNRFLKNNLESIKAYPPKTLDIALVKSVLRYGVYMLQYLVLLYCFGIELPIWITLSGIALIFLVQTGLPLPPVLGMLARGEVALLVWGVFGIAPLPVLAATISLWFINKAIPAVLGIVLLIQVKQLRF